LFVAFVESLNEQTKRVGKSKKHLRISTQKIIFNLHNSGVESNKKVSRPKKMKNSLKLTLWEMENYMLFGDTLEKRLTLK